MTTSGLFRQNAIGPNMSISVDLLSYYFNKHYFDFEYLQQKFDYLMLNLKAPRSIDTVIPTLQHYNSPESRPRISVFDSASTSSTNQQTCAPVTMLFLEIYCFWSEIIFGCRFFKLFHFYSASPALEIRTIKGTRVRTEDSRNFFPNQSFLSSSPALKIG